MGFIEIISPILHENPKHSFIATKNGDQTVEQNKGIER